MENAFKLRLKDLTLTGVLLAMVLALQFLAIPKILLGVVVNSILILLLEVLNIRYALMLCILTPVGAMISGQLPIVLFPLLPVLIAGNSILVVAYNFIKPAFRFLQVVLPSLLKAAFIGLVGWAAVRIIAESSPVKWAAAAVLGIQFFTATGGIVLGKVLARHVKATFPNWNNYSPVPFVSENNGAGEK